MFLIRHWQRIPTDFSHSLQRIPAAFQPLPRSTCLLIPSRTMSHNLRDKELADEKRYANKQDEDKLRDLREKLKKEATLKIIPVEDKERKVPAPVTSSTTAASE